MNNDKYKLDKQVARYEPNNICASCLNEASQMQIVDSLHKYEADYFKNHLNLHGDNMICDQCYQSAVESMMNLCDNPTE